MEKKERTLASYKEHI
jgi:phosphoenolpyruvate-protein kinase (PTS system EI component)